MLKTLHGALRSRVIWFNIITSALEIANAIAPVIAPGLLLPVNIAGNIILRFVTSKPLTEK